MLSLRGLVKNLFLLFSYYFQAIIAIRLGICIVPDSSTKQIPPHLYPREYNLAVRGRRWPVSLVPTPRSALVKKSSVAQRLSATCPGEVVESGPLSREESVPSAEKRSALNEIEQKTRADSLVAWTAASGHKSRESLFSSMACSFPLFGRP